MSKPSFREATDRILRCIPAEQLAAEMGVARNTIARARMDPDSPNYRPPPQGWEKAIARLSAAQGADLSSLAAELDP